LANGAGSGSRAIFKLQHLQSPLLALSVDTFQSRRQFLDCCYW